MILFDMYIYVYVYVYIYINIIYMRFALMRVTN